MNSKFRIHMPQYNNVVIFFFAIYILIVPFLLPAASATIAISGLIALFVLKNFESLSKFKLGPLEAIIRDAKDNLQETRELALGLAKINLEILIGGSFGFEDGLSIRRRFEMHDNIIKSLQKLDISDDDIDDAESQWRLGVNFMFINQIIHLFEMREKKSQINTNDPDGDQRRKVTASIRELGNFKSLNAPKPSQVRDTIIEAGFEVSPNVDEMINQYEKFLESGKIENQDEFLNFYDEQ